MLKFFVVFGSLWGLAGFAQEVDASDPSEKQESLWPHTYSYVSSGALYQVVSGADPEDAAGTLEVTGTDQYSLLLGVAYGLEKSLWGHSMAFGYHLDIDWTQGPERRKRYLKNPGDLKFAPIVPRYTDRTHRLRWALDRLEGMGRYGFVWELTTRYIGSDIVPGPGVERLETTHLGNGYHFSPYAGVAFGDDVQHSSRLQAVFHKFRSQEQDDFSFKTHEGSGVGAYYFHHDVYYTELSSLVSLRLLQYDFTFQESEEDFLRRGIMVGATQYYGDFRVKAMYASFEDAFEEPVVVAGTCGDNGESVVLVACDRMDQIKQYRLGLSYYVGSDGRADFVFDHLSQTVPDFPEYDTERSSVLMQYTWTWDDFRKVASFEDQFGDFGLRQKQQTSF